MVGTRAVLGCRFIISGPFPSAGPGRLDHRRPGPPGPSVRGVNRQVGSGRRGRGPAEPARARRARRPGPPGRRGDRCGRAGDRGNRPLAGGPADPGRARRTEPPGRPWCAGRCSQRILRTNRRGCLSTPRDLGGPPGCRGAGRPLRIGADASAVGSRGRPAASVVRLKNTAWLTWWISSAIWGSVKDFRRASKSPSSIRAGSTVSFRANAKAVRSAGENVPWAGRSIAKIASSPTPRAQPVSSAGRARTRSGRPAPRPRRVGP